MKLEKPLVFEDFLNCQAFASVTQRFGLCGYNTIRKNWKARNGIAKSQARRVKVESGVAGGNEGKGAMRQGRCEESRGD